MPHPQTRHRIVYAVVVVAGLVAVLELGLWDVFLSPLRPVIYALDAVTSGLTAARDAVIRFVENLSI